MKRIDEKYKDAVQFDSSDKSEWLKNYTMSLEDQKKLILEKYHRAEAYQKSYKKVLFFDDTH